MAKKHKKVLFLFSVLFGVGLVLPLGAWGASLYFEPSRAQLKMGQEFGVKVKIDPEKECINTIKAEIEYNKNLLVVKDFLMGESLISIWLEKPKIEDGKISFSGGIPGGYCGKIAGDPGESNILGEIIFRVPEILVGEKGVVEVKFSKNSKVLLNDGLGTEAQLKLEKAIYQILKERDKSLEKILEKELKKDTAPPEPFGILVLKDPQVFEGRYFIIFNTQDKQTGIDHYEVKEGENPWKIAESPHLLEDQNLKSIIKVKAVDKAGNERIVEFRPYLPKRLSIINWIIGLALILIGVGYWTYLKRKLRLQKENEK